MFPCIYVCMQHVSACVYMHLCVCVCVCVCVFPGARFLIQFDQPRRTPEGRQKILDGRQTHAPHEDVGRLWHRECRMATPSLGTPSPSPSQLIYHLNPHSHPRRCPLSVLRARTHTHTHMHARTHAHGHSRSRAPAPSP